MKINYLRVTKTVISVLLLVGAGVLMGWYYPKDVNYQTALFKPRTLDKYALPYLKEAVIEPGELTIVSKTNTEKYIEGTFNLTFKPELTGDNKKSSGEYRLPTGGQKYPIIVMLRGYVDQSIFTTGIGTRNASIFFAQNGFITLAPDFLGYGNSDTQAGDVFEARFQTYTLTLSLLQTLSQKRLPADILNAWDGNVFIWAHSNGGQIALTVLETSNQTIPTALWAPVSKPFPYSVLYYTDESGDEGWFIRKSLASFEQRYNPNLYSLTKYLSDITSPILVQQGTNDDAVPLAWSDDLVDKLEDLQKEVDYKVYEGADHNLRPGWDQAIADALAFFLAHKK